jgi:glycosyltransferase involved in cell wall biosynthesis
LKETTLSQAADITVCIATIPPRVNELARAVKSVTRQTLQPMSIIIEYDHGKTGAPATKNRAIAKATTEWVAMLDDDDEFLPHHLQALHTTALSTGADVVYSIPHIPQIPGNRDPDGRYGVPFDADELRRRSYIQTTSLVRRELFMSVGGFQVPKGLMGPDDHRANYDDWGGWLAMLDAGAKFVHCPEVTFVWNHWGFGRPGRPGNTSGRADRW